MLEASTGSGVMAIAWREINRDVPATETEERATPISPDALTSPPSEAGTSTEAVELCEAMTAPELEVEDPIEALEDDGAMNA